MNQQPDEKRSDRHSLDSCAAGLAPCRFLHRTGCLQFMDESAAGRKAERPAKSRFVRRRSCPHAVFCTGQAVSQFMDESADERRAERPTQSRFVRRRSYPMPFSAPDGSYSTSRMIRQSGKERKDRRSSRFRRKCCSNSRFAAPAGSLYTTTKLPTRRGREFFLLIRPPGFRQALQFPPVRCRQRPHRRCRHPPGVPSRHPPHGR